MGPGQVTVGKERVLHPATLLLLGAMLVSGALLVVLGTRLSFLLDDWTYILFRRDFNADAFLLPANEHLVAGPVVLWKLLIAGFGIDSTLSFRFVSAAMLFLGTWFLFVWLRRRLGEWPALIATVPVLFLGAAFDDFLWISAAFPFLAGTACGLGMLLALDRRDATGDRIACAWLVGALLFSSLWFAFAAGAAVDIALRRRDRSWQRRAYVVLLPLALYAIWWLGWGHQSESAVSLHNLATTPRFVFDAFAAALAALFGLATPVDGITSPAGLEWGRPLAVLAGALAAWRLYRLERIPRSLWVLLTIVLTFWALGGLADNSGRAPWDSRYQYSGVVLILLIAAEMLRGVKLERRLLAPVLIVVAASMASNLLFLELAYESYRRTSETERADLAAVEIARKQVSPDLLLSEDIAGTSYVSVPAGSYLSARDDYGSPAYTPAELAAAPAEARLPADKVLAAALGIGLLAIPEPAPAGPPPRLLEPASARIATGGSCLTVRSSAAAPTIVELSPGGALLRQGRGGPVQVNLRRFADSFPVELGALPAREWSEIAIPTDRSTRPWQAQLAGSGTIAVCGNTEHASRATP